MPGRGKRAEMVQTNHLDMREQRAQPGNAPFIAGFAKSIPVVYRISPKLARSAEQVRRNTGCESWTALLVQQKEFWICPDVARIGRDEKRKIADNAHTFTAGMRLEPLALPEQQELDETNLTDLIRQLLPGSIYRGWIAADKLRRPLEVICSIKPFFKDPEERVVFQPVRLVIAELLESRPEVRANASAEVGPCLIEQS